MQPTATRAASPVAPGEPDAGLFGPDSEAWRLNREAMLLLGAGPRALLLQVAHPLVAEGVEQHSDFRLDPWRRLEETLRSFLAITYGSTARARGEIRRLNHLHQAIRGPVRDPDARAAFGEAYRARDPELSLWVHATLVDSTMAVVDAWLEPLAAERRARIYAETRPVARAFGVPDALVPADLDAFEAYMARMLGPGGPVRPTATSRGIAHAILHPPIAPVVPALGWLPAWSYSWTLWPAVGLLPPVVREGYGLSWGARERAVSAWLVAAWRAWRPLVPTALRWMPQARAADRRMAARQMAARR